MTTDTKMQKDMALVRKLAREIALVCEGQSNAVIGTSLAVYTASFLTSITPNVDAASSLLDLMYSDIAVHVSALADVAAAASKH